MNIAFLSNNTNFFLRHFAPALEAASEGGHDITLFLPEKPSETTGLNEGVRVSVAPVARKGAGVPNVLNQAVWLLRELRGSRQNLVMAFSLRACLVLAIVLPFVRCDRVIFSITGLGLISLLTDTRTRVVRWLVYRTFAWAARSDKAYFVFENRSDRVAIGLPAGSRSILLMGAGVDEREFMMGPMPSEPPLKLVVASRLIWSKGIDIAVEAVSSLIGKGYAVELSIYGLPDPDNPRPVAYATLEEWSHRAGIRYCGHGSDMPRVWADHHVALFPTRGGEGLPRALLEAAATGRPCIVTDVPGCADFIRDGLEGLVVEKESVSELEGAIVKLLENPGLRDALGQAARCRVLANSTVEITKTEYRALFDLVEQRQLVS